ncbi:hypothetical protein FS749_000196 [Ceratobasidium sp. UAMH 11750]|nr:hypothetical protein FS749_000196 [Ceratobasidium sp. UAMH 11750]
MSITQRFLSTLIDMDPTPASAPRFSSTDLVKNKSRNRSSNRTITAVRSTEPGTYRITNVASDTSITSSDEDALCRRIEDSEAQYWIVHRVGHGYQFENCGTGRYLCVDITDIGTTLHCGYYPTTWELSKDPREDDAYTIRCPGTHDRIIELDSWGYYGRMSRLNATKIVIQSEDRWTPERAWKFERSSDDTNTTRISSKDKKIAALEKQLAENTQALAEAKKKLEGKNKTIAEQSASLAEKDRQLAQTTQDLDRLGNNLVRTSTLLTQTQDALYRSNESIALRDCQISRIQDHPKFESLEAEIVQHREMMKKMAEKLEAFEQVLSQIPRPNNIS